MAYRKRVENWLETGCKFWGNRVKFTLVDADCSSYVWHIVHGNTQYAVVYSDLGELTLTAISVKHSTLNTVRHIYHGDNSEASFDIMMSRLADNFVHMV
jgi:hypothetical protein